MPATISALPGQCAPTLSPRFREHSPAPWISALLWGLLALLVSAAPLLAGEATVDYQGRDEKGCDVYEITSPDGITYLSILERTRPAQGLDISVDKGFVAGTDEGVLYFFHMTAEFESVTVTICPKGRAQNRELDYRLLVYTEDEVKSHAIDPEDSPGLLTPVAAELWVRDRLQVLPAGSDRFEATYDFDKENADCDTVQTIEEKNVEDVTLVCREEAFGDPTVDLHLAVVEVIGRIVDPQKEAFVAVTIDPAGTIVQLNTLVEPQPRTRDDCRYGPRPAATLLYPYFEVGPGFDAVTTLLSISNAAAECTLARTTLWTDWGVPTLSFYVYLSPFDVQTVNLRDVFSGRLPETSGTLASPECPVLDFDVCTAEELDHQLDPEQVASLRSDHTGAPNPVTGGCAGSDFGDGVLRGYVTVDTVEACAISPTVHTADAEAWLAQEGYFEATGTAMDNHLWGDQLLVDPRGNFAQGEPAIHVPADPGRFGPGDYTFYGRYTGFDGSDGRVPLSSEFNVRFLDGGPFDAGTRLFVWRDDRAPVRRRSGCGELPPGLPLGSGSIRVFDEEERGVQVPGLASVCEEGAKTLSFRCTVRPDIDDPIAFGYLDMDLGLTEGTPAQAWVMPVMSAEGRYSVGYRSIPTNSLCGTLVDEPTP